MSANEFLTRSQSDQAEIFTDLQCGPEVVLIEFIWTKLGGAWG